jgi:uncharacterized protein YbcV (DUF1398 family)
MLLRGDVTTFVQKRGPMPRPAGSEMGLAFDGQFSTRLIREVLDTRQSNQTRFLRFCNMDKTAWESGVLIEVGKRIGCV